MLRIKRVYDPTSEEDGFRILVDRLWPRGLSKEKAQLDLWIKEIAPSDELRQEFCHDPKKWREFKEKYHAELASKPNLVNQVRQLEKEKGTVTLVYSAKLRLNNAVALKQFLKKKQA